MSFLACFAAALFVGLALEARAKRARLIQMRIDNAANRAYFATVGRK